MFYDYDYGAHAASTLLAADILHVLRDYAPSYSLRTRYVSQYDVRCSDAVYGWPTGDSMCGMQDALETRAVRIELFTARVLCRVSSRALD